MSAQAALPPPLLALRGVSRDYPSGEGVVTVLRDANLDLHRGEMIAIMGPSGSGKSTLMNMIGCLDQPTRGSYRVDGEETGAMSPDALARLRREYFGFVFQRYQLVNVISAQANVEMPAVYADMPPDQRSERARKLLARLGLSERTEHRPNQLSGGQQQRVSIARSLMNGGTVVLADEPTGALDSHSGADVMRILEELNAAGHTIILVTHDAKVAAHARRVIEISDGRIVADNGPDVEGIARAMGSPPSAPSHDARSLRMRWARFSEAMRMAMRAMAGHRLRTFLTMLGIIIGIASVIAVFALGSGSKRKILRDINTFGTTTVDIMPGSGYGDRNASAIQTLVPEDAAALAKIPGVIGASPITQSGQTVRIGNREKSASLQGVNADFAAIKGYRLAKGRWFDAESVRSAAQDAVIDSKTVKALFEPGTDPIGATLIVGTMQVRVIGVLRKSDSDLYNNSGLTMWLPYTTLGTRLTGTSRLDSIVVGIDASATAQDVERALTRTLSMRHGRKDFFTNSSDQLRQMVEKTMGTMTLLISSIAVISLIVGGIGVMNIMLVSVTERTQEIGVRMAIGARQSDIMRQFLIEAIAVCMVGGLLGIGVAFGLGAVFNALVPDFSMVFSPMSVVVAVLCSTLIGATFGFLPARSAARLNPVDALAHQ